MTQRSPRGSVGASAPQTHHLYTGNVRPISYAELSAIFGDEPIDIHSYYAERIQAEPEPRHLSRFDWSCIAVALMSLAYFVVRVVA